MTPGLHNVGRRLLGIGAGTGFFSGLSTFFVGAFVAGAVLSFIKKDGPRIAGAFRHEGSHGDKTLDELIIEKEQLEDLIAEKAAKEGKA